YGQLDKSSAEDEEDDYLLQYYLGATDAYDDEDDTHEGPRQKSSDSVDDWLKSPKIRKKLAKYYDRKAGVIPVSIIFGVIDTAHLKGSKKHIKTSLPLPNGDTPGALTVSFTGLNFFTQKAALRAMRQALPYQVPVRYITGKNTATAKVAEILDSSHYEIWAQEEKLRRGKRKKELSKFFKHSFSHKKSVSNRPSRDKIVKQQKNKEETEI
ncbi:MAG: hypothetical protein Q4C71_02380, partial [Microbacteriaceae bacterium]|nr:hypothetical protein [Microbacteriaceae bacterium]